MGFQDADAREVAVALGEIQTVAYDKLVGNLEAYQVGFKLNFATTSFIEEHASPYTGGVHFLDHGNKHGQRFSRIENIVDEQDVSVCEIQRKVAENLWFPNRAGFVSVAGYANAVESSWVFDLANEISGEKNSPVNHGNDRNFLFPIELSDFEP